MKARFPAGQSSLPLILGGVLVIGVLSMPREEYIGDPVAVRCETVSLINNGDLAVPPAEAKLFGGERGKYFFQNPTNAKWYSKWGIMNTLIEIPPLLAEKWWTGKLPYVSPARVIFLNVFNLLLALASAGYLGLIASKYARSWLAVPVFVLSAFYCTYWWNYLRAQNSEIYQTLLLLAFYYHATARNGGGTGREATAGQPIRAGIFLGVLILVKTVYVILIPVLFGWIFFRELGRWRTLPGGATAGSLGRMVFHSARGFFIPAAISVLILLAVDDYKFGSPLTTGFGQWQPNGKSLFSGNIFYGVYLMLFDIQGSAFLAFPLLIFALFGYRRFCAAFPWDAGLFLAMGAVLLLTNAHLASPLGPWAYGPRYLLVILPLLSLPFLATFEFLVGQLRRPWAIVCLAIMGLSLGYSCRLQLNVNAFPFFTFYYLQDFFSEVRDPLVDDYFTSHTYGALNGEFIAMKEGRSTPLLELATMYLTPSGKARFVGLIDEKTPSNYYWARTGGGSGR